MDTTDPKRGETIAKNASKLSDDELCELLRERRARLLASQPLSLTEAMGFSAPWLWSALEREQLAEAAEGSNAPGSLGPSPPGKGRI